MHALKSWNIQYMVFQKNVNISSSAFQLQARGDIFETQNISSVRMWPAAISAATRKTVK